MRISDWSSDVCSSDLFRVSASAGYIDAYYRRINDPSGTITLASRLPRVPKWTATLSPEFNVFLANEGRVTLRADYSYKSTMAADAENTPELFSGNVSLVNASLTYSAPGDDRSEEHTSELQSLMRISYAVFCLKKKQKNHNHKTSRI